VLGIQIASSNAPFLYFPFTLFGIGGQGPSDHPDFARWLVEKGITSISLNPDSVVETWEMLGKSLKA